MAVNLTRRRFVGLAGRALGALGVGERLPAAGAAAQDTAARLTARPRTGAPTTLKTGPLGLGSDRDGLIQLPATRPPGRLAVLLFLHGATQGAASVVRRMGPAADQAGIVLVAPESRDRTWDAIRGDFGDDVAFLNRTLDFVFAHADVDPARLTVGGFSDGASYGLSLGLANGDLFSRVMACSPGFVIQAPPRGRPRVFVSHGTADQILPIDQCSRVIVPRLRSMGYDVTLREFDGRHELPPEVAGEAARWMLAQ